VGVVDATRHVVSVVVQVFSGCVEGFLLPSSNVMIDVHFNYCAVLFCTFISCCIMTYRLLAQYSSLTWLTRRSKAIKIIVAFN